MSSQTSFQTRGLWPSAVPNFYPHSAPTFEPLLSRSSTTDFTRQAIRPLTPPEDMSSLAYNVRPLGNRYQEPGVYNADREPRRLYGSATDHIQENHGISHFSKASAQQVSRQSSPTPSHQSFTSSSSQQQHQRKASQASQIAPSLQIPRTINNSQGSLSELAAQVTCLFWFESSAVLDFAEDPSSVVFPLPNLKKETTPSSGFRKWVTTIISTTQVAQNVIVLALLFIYRLKRQNPSVQGKEGSEYRLLTVALMLGNKFLDDNTYTNKTWADVSGISVAEVHIMEVEFLSNMKYNLFTSAEQWAQWQTQLGKFARFLERASHPPVLPLPQSGHGQINLPSPPTSFQASPPRVPSPGVQTFYGSHFQQPNLTVNTPSPLAPVSNPNVRKRSLEEDGIPQVAKRVMHSSSFQNQSQDYATFSKSSISGSYDAALQARQNRLSQSGPLVDVPATQSSHPQIESGSLTRLPPLTQHLRNPVPTTQSSWHAAPASIGPIPSSMAVALQSARSSRNHSPYLSSTTVSPTNTSLLPVNNQSPSFFLRQRDSPYKPVRGVHTLLVPPPSRAMHQPEHVGNSQMHYQPLGRPQERQTGRLPYVAQNQWHDPSLPKLGTPVAQWQPQMHAPYPNYQRPHPPHIH
ncbi:hypothetical protein CAC42_2476 [Sphaceloma murrayae]|uniref:Meiotically up-regulated protein 80 protein n=1 Tax=Sphaceloma murrayae TaxID=2082308 RepID=A0A2K1QWA5_9PEZI|nr:hypothetical protein CAC42_2476 [Sphaceloma murrayae]